MALKENLRRFRLARGLKQEPLAKLAGVSQQLIVEIEKGRVKSTKSVYNLAKALGVAAWELDPNIPAPEPGEDSLRAILADPEAFLEGLNKTISNIKNQKAKPPKMH